MSIFYKTSVGGDVAEPLHYSVSDHRCSVNGERPHHADDVTFKKDLPAVSFILVTEALRHSFILKLPEFIRLHQSFYVVKRVVEHPIHCSSNAACQEWHIEGKVLLIDSSRGEHVSYLLDGSEIKH